MTFSFIYAPFMSKVLENIVIRAIFYWKEISFVYWYPDLAIHKLQVCQALKILKPLNSL